MKLTAKDAETTNSERRTMNEDGRRERRGTHQALVWHGHRLILLDQSLLPARIKYVRPFNYQGVVTAIQRLAVRGAPLIGVAGALGLALEARRNPNRRHLLQAALALKSARPTAINLAWAVERLEMIVRNRSVPDRELAPALEQEALTIQHQEEQRSLRMGKFGANLIKNNDKILTICNAGWLAAPGLGTALAAIYVAHRQRKKVTVYVPETRPLLQGGRLTAFELKQAGIDCVVLTDSMVATVMPEIDLVLVGADRIARNGDTANKIGTFQMALIARHFKKPFYPVAPVSTFDFRARTGNDLPIEQRAPEELIFCGARQIAPPGVRFHNPAFDVTPARLITGIVTDQGILKPPFRPAIAGLRIGRSFHCGRRVAC
jgi:methylthioribose-1-phosphate isomerase